MNWPILVNMMSGWVILGSVREKTFRILNACFSKYLLIYILGYYLLQETYQ